MLLKCKHSLDMMDVLQKAMKKFTSSSKDYETLFTVRIITSFISPKLAFGSKISKKDLVASFKLVRDMMLPNVENLSLIVDKDQVRTIGYVICFLRFSLLPSSLGFPVDTSCVTCSVYSAPTKMVGDIPNT